MEQFDGITVRIFDQYLRAPGARNWIISKLGSGEAKPGHQTFQVLDCNYDPIPTTRFWYTAIRHRLGCGRVGAAQPKGRVVVAQDSEGGAPLLNQLESDLVYIKCGGNTHIAYKVTHRHASKYAEFVSFVIRMATAEDSLVAAAAVKACYDEYGFTWEPEGYHADLYDLEQFYLGVGDPFWVAEIAGEVVATCALELFDRIPGEPGRTVLHHGKVRAAGADCSLERLYVHPKGRRRGIGAALFETTIADARRRNRNAMEIWSDKEFGDAHRLYERYGATVIGDRICDDPDAAQEWGLVLKL